MDQTILKTLIKTLIGIIIILLITWLRFIREIKGYSFEELDAYMYSKLWFISCLMSLFFYILFNIMQYKVKKESFMKNRFFEHPFLKYLSRVILEYFLKAPEYVYLSISNKFNLKRLIELPASYIGFYFNYPRFVVWTLYFLPQIIVATLFVIEVCVFHQVIYFYKSLFLLVIVLIARILRFIVDSYSQRMVVHLEQFIDVRFNSEDDIEHSMKSPELLPKGWSMGAVIEKYGVISNLWLIYHEIHNYTQSIYNYYISYISYVLLYTSTCYLIGWSYLLLYLYIHF